MVVAVLAELDRGRGLQKTPLLTLLLSSSPDRRRWSFFFLLYGVGGSSGQVIRELLLLPSATVTSLADTQLVSSQPASGVPRQVFRITAKLCGES
mgnify:FL=1